MERRISRAGIRVVDLTTSSFDIIQIFEGYEGSKMNLPSNWSDSRSESKDQPLPRNVSHEGHSARGIPF
jgi:hypothetical protein